MDREVDLRELRSRFVLLVTIKGHALHRVLAGILDKVARLNEHSARTARWIEDYAVVRFDDVDNGLNDRGRREKLAVVVRPLFRELGEEVFIDAAEHVAGRRAKGFG